MPTIELETVINAPLARCFDLARSIDFHQASMAGSGESAVRGMTSGLIGLGQQVTWRARHFGVWQELTSEVTVCERPFYFRDEMRAGAFQALTHDHWFVDHQGKTLIKERFDYTAPWGSLGKVADALFLKRYMTTLLRQHNIHLQHTLETEAWQIYLSKDGAFEGGRID